MSVESHRCRCDCASLPRPCCSSDIQPVLCCYITVVRASFRIPLRLWLSPWPAWRGCFSPGACRPICALLQLSALYLRPITGRRTEKGGGGLQGCRLQVQSGRARMTRCDGVESRSSSHVLASLALSRVAPWCAAPPAGDGHEHRRTVTGRVYFSARFQMRTANAECSLF